MEPPPALPAAPSTPLELFLALVRISSPSGSEDRVISAIEDWLTSCGVVCERDGSAALTGSDTGNLIARRSTAPDRPTLMFLSHVDTVQGVNDDIQPVVIEPDDNQLVVIDEPVVRSRRDTILGADNKAAVAALLSLLARPRSEHANLVAVFTTSEERGVMGVTALGPLADEIDLAFPVDGSYPVGTVLESALGQVPFRLRVHGRRAHAAKDPDKGIHAIQAAAEIVAGLQMGWTEDSVLNISAINGGAETNVIPDFAELRGEVRAFSPGPLAARLDLVGSVADAVAARRGVTVELVEHTEEGAPPFPPAEAVTNLAIAGSAMADLGIDMIREACSATLEANFLHGFGLPTLGIASGGQGPHSVTESLRVSELDRLSALLDRMLVHAAGVTESSRS